MAIENVGPENSKERNLSPGVAKTEDVAGLFTWAKLEGSKYRDFSVLRDRHKADARMKLETEMTVTSPEPPLQAPVQQDAAPPGELGIPFVPAVRTQPARATGREFSSRMQRASENNARRKQVATMPLERGQATGMGPRRLPQVTPKRSKPAEREISSRWVALKHAFDPDDNSQGESGGAGGAALPSVAFISLAGGVGKTSLVASVGCLLASSGVSSLLVDTHAYGLLPLFFGARELSPGTSRTFSGGSERAPVRVMTLDHAADDLRGPVPLAEQIAHHTEAMNLVLVDVSTGSVDVLRQVMDTFPTVLVVLKPDMASVVSLQTLDMLFELMNEEKDHALDVHFVLNQVDDSMRLHLDVRERLKRQLGKRLLPFVLHESGMVSEALAECMTIVDYAPDAQLVEDLGRLAQWISELDEPSAVGLPDLRWRER